jgi:hypothetical protein
MQPLGDAFVTLTLPHPPRNETTMNLWCASSLGSPLHTYQGYSDAIKDFGFRVGVDMRGMSWAGLRVAVICISACITHGLSWQVVGGNSQLNVSVHTAWALCFLQVFGGGLQFRVFCHASLVECVYVCVGFTEPVGSRDSGRRDGDAADHVDQGPRPAAHDNGQGTCVLLLHAHPC